MLRRDFIAGSGALAIALLGGCATGPKAVKPPSSMQRAVGQRQSAAGLVAMEIGPAGKRVMSHGSSGIDGLPMDDRTVFEVGSITKVMTALLLADMAARGEVRLEDPVLAYLPQPASLQPKGRDVTLLDLATYTSGLPRMPGNMPAGWNTSVQPLGGYTTDMLFAFLRDYTPGHDAGSYYEYSNLAFGLLGAVLARRAGTTFERLLIERILDPLGMKETRITLSPALQARAAQGHDLGMERKPMLEMPGLQGAGAVRSTLGDMGKFLSAAMHGGRSRLKADFDTLLETRHPTSLPGTQAAMAGSFPRAPTTRLSGSPAPRAALGPARPTRHEPIRAPSCFPITCGGPPKAHRPTPGWSTSR